MDRHRNITSFDSRSVIMLRSIKKGIMSLLLRTLKAEEKMGTKEREEWQWSDERECDVWRPHGA